MPKKTPSKDSWAEPIPLFSFLLLFSLADLAGTLTRTWFCQLFIWFIGGGCITFAWPEGSGSGLCRGATCQEYIRPLRHLRSLTIGFKKIASFADKGGYNGDHVSVFFCCQTVPILLFRFFIRKLSPESLMISTPVQKPVQDGSGNNLVAQVLGPLFG